MAKTGKTLERVVANVEKVLGNDGAVSVERRKKLRDKTTGRLREHDVLIRVRHSHHEIVIALECRDRSRKVTVEQIEGFKAKCDHTGVDCGGIVSPKGFTAGALLKAQHLGIRCLQFNEVSAFRWLLMPGILCMTQRILSTHFRFNLLSPPQDKPTELAILSSNDEEVTTANLAPFVHQRFTDLSQEKQFVGRGAAALRFSGSNLRIRDNSTGRIYDVGPVDVRIEYEITSKLAPFELASYTSAANGEKITDVARAEIDLPVGKGELMIVYNEEEGGQIVLVGKGTEV